MVLEKLTYFENYLDLKVANRLFLFIGPGSSNPGTPVSGPPLSSPGLISRNSPGGTPQGK